MVVSGGKGQQEGVKETKDRSGIRRRQRVTGEGERNAAEGVAGECPRKQQGEGILSGTKAGRYTQAGKTDAKRMKGITLERRRDAAAQPHA